MLEGKSAQNQKCHVTQGSAFWFFCFSDTKKIKKGVGRCILNYVRSYP